MNRGLADLARFDAIALLQALAARRISAVELLEASVRRADATAAVNAVVLRDLDAARLRARVIDEKRAQGDADGLGLLAGLPMTVKDNLDVEGMPASTGSTAMLDRRVRDAAAVARARAQDAVIWGKTNAAADASDAQTFNGLYGTTNNPWDLALTPGGSSGGSAAALATGASALEIGSDLTGSLRLPASFCGVYAHKPTYGMVPHRGHVPPAPGTVAEPDLAVIGPMARSARDLRLLLAVLSQAPLAARAPPADLQELKVGLWLDEPAFPLDPEVRTVLEAFAAKVAKEGVQVEAIKSPVDAEVLLDTFTTLSFSFQYAGQARAWMRGPARIARRLGADRLSWAGLALAAGASHAEWLAANETRARMEVAMRRAFSRHQVILCPAAPVAAFPHDHGPMGKRRVRLGDGRRIVYAHLHDWSTLATTCGLPATVIPAGQTAAGLPVGLQIIGPRGGDSKTLAVAQAFEERLGGFIAPPIG